MTVKFSSNFLFLQVKKMMKKDKKIDKKGFNRRLFNDL
jgi:hypothetical protein